MLLVTVLPQEFIHYYESLAVHSGLCLTSYFSFYVLHQNNNTHRDNKTEHTEGEARTEGDFSTTPAAIK